jgi:glycosyltransferase involved in cell wall biosynthesis
MGPFLTVFIPAYNEEHNLDHCVESVLAKFAALQVSVEVLIVDDCSSDCTGAVADQIAAQREQVRVIHHERNGGIGAAFLTASQHAQGEWLILIPADLAIEPDELRRYLAVVPSADVIVGLRSDLSDYNLVRKVVHFANILLVRALFHMPLHQFQYISMYRMKVLCAMQIEYWRSAFFLAEILIKASALGFRIVEVEVLYTPRLTGRATGAKLELIFHTLWDLFHFWLRWMRLGPGQASRSTQESFWRR